MDPPARTKRARKAEEPKMLVNICDAKSQLSKLIVAAEAGATT